LIKGLAISIFIFPGFFDATFSTDFSVSTTVDVPVEEKIGSRKSSGTPCSTIFFFR
jgi:hypothetical protein